MTTLLDHRTKAPLRLHPALARSFAWCGEAISRRAVQAGILLALCVSALDLVELGRPSLWLDETYSVGLAQQPYATMARYLWDLDPNMELYYLMLHVWLWVARPLGFLPLEVVARLPSVIAAALAGGVLFALGYRFWGWTAGLVSVLVYAVSNYQLTYAQQARSYSFEVLFATLAWLAFLALLNKSAHRRLWWAVFGLATVLGIYNHLYAVFVLLSQLGALALLLVLRSPWRAQARSLLRPMAVCVLLIAHLSFPMILVARNGGNNNWIQPATLRDVVSIFLIDVSGGSLIYLALLASLIMFLVLLTIYAYHPRTAPHWFREPPSRLGEAPAPALWLFRAVPWPGILALSCWLMVPLVLSFAVTQPYLNLHLFLYRYEIVVLPSICLLVGIAVSLFRHLTARVGLALLLLAAAAPTVPVYFAHAEIQDYRSAATWVESQYQGGDGIACFPLYDCARPMNVYFANDGGPTAMDPGSPGGNDLQTGQDQPVNLTDVETYAGQHTRLFYISAPIASSQATLAQGRAILSYLQTKYVQVATFHSLGVTVYLFDIP